MTYQIVEYRPDSKFISILMRVCANDADGIPGDADDYVSSLNFGVMKNEKLVGALTCEIDDFKGKPSLSVLAACALPGENVLPKMVEFVENGARICGASYVFCKTVRPGLSKILRFGYGWSRIDRVHFKEIL